MHAWLCTQPTGVDNLAWTELPTPVPKRGEVLIEIRAASLNFPDLLIVQNKYQMKPDPPFVPGSEYAGVVQAVGEGVEHLRVGQNVACLTGTGGFATHAIAPAALCMPLPDGFPHVDAAAFIMIYATSHHALVDRAQLRAGETVLVLGAAGGVGTAAIQIAKKMGARVIAAASSDEKCALCLSTGADAVINYSAENLREAIKGLTDGKGPDVIYDPVGGDFTEPAFRSIAWRGRYLVVGFAAGPIPSLPLNLALLKGASIVGVFWGEFSRREPKANAAMMAEPGALVWRRRGQAGDRPHHAHGATACGLRTDGFPGRAGQAGAGELTCRAAARPRSRVPPRGTAAPARGAAPAALFKAFAVCHTRGPSSAVHARWPTAPLQRSREKPSNSWRPAASRPPRTTTRRCTRRSPARARPRLFPMRNCATSCGCSPARRLPRSGCSASSRRPSSRGTGHSSRACWWAMPTWACMPAAPLRWRQPRHR